MKKLFILPVLVLGLSFAYAQEATPVQEGNKPDCEKPCCKEGKKGEWKKGEGKKGEGKKFKKGKKSEEAPAPEAVA